jgi:hypothetical protein
MSGAIDLLREAAVVLRDPAGRDMESVDAVATALEVIAARAAEWDVAGLLAVEAVDVSMAPLPGERSQTHEDRVRAATRDVERSRRFLAQFLRECHFDVEEVPNLIGFAEDREEHGDA